MENYKETFTSEIVNVKLTNWKGGNGKACKVNSFHFPKEVLKSVDEGSNETQIINVPLEVNYYL